MSGQTVVQPAARRLERSRSDRMLAGVSGGLARYFGIHPAFYRVGFVVLALIGGAGILIYLAAALVIPDEGKEDSIASAALRERRDHPLPLIASASPRSPPPCCLPRQPLAARATRPGCFSSSPASGLPAPGRRRPVRRSRAPAGRSAGEQPSRTPRQPAAAEARAAALASGGLSIVARQPARAGCSYGRVFVAVFPVHLAADRQPDVRADLRRRPPPELSAGRRRPLRRPAQLSPAGRRDAADAPGWTSAACA